MPRIEDALQHLSEAMRALTIEATAIPVDEEVAPYQVPRIQFTLGEELDRIDRALGPKGATVLAGMAENIRQAVIEIEAARLALEERP